MTDDVVPPTSIDHREGDGRRTLARLRDALPEGRDAPTRDQADAGDAEDWAAARTKLGFAYAQRSEGDRSENWELAIAAFTDALSARPRAPWRSGGPIDLTTLVVLGLLLVSTLSLLQFGVTEWEWRVRDEWPFERAAWVYPVVVLVIGAVEAHLALHALRRVGSATALALLALLVQAAFVADARAVLPPGPWLVSHLLLVAPAVALDLWYAARLARASAGSTLLGGALLYAAVYFAVALPLIGRLMPYPAFDLSTLLPTVALGTLATLLVSFLASVVIRWLATAGALAPRVRSVHAVPLVASAG